MSTKVSSKADPAELQSENTYGFTPAPDAYKPKPTRLSGTRKPAISASEFFTASGTKAIEV